jgi:hypothetical protein
MVGNVAVIADLIEKTPGPLRIVVANGQKYVGTLLTE